MARQTHPAGQRIDSLADAREILCDDQGVIDREDCPAYVGYEIVDERGVFKLKPARECPQCHSWDFEFEWFDEARQPMWFCSRCELRRPPSEPPEPLEQ